ncbi:PAS domain-containing protein [Phenylobacterium sp.]|jgi:hypothetical protein|uniref:motility/cell cycle regulatory protein MopJ n=1 Tax=Phenylobacterium sp. TaxID=1871053 RepID=UPI0037845819
MAAQIGLPTAAARAHEELLRYWATRRQGARLPARRDIDPGGFKRLLPTISLIDVAKDPLDFRIRLAGTELYGVYGREITGRTLGEVYASGAAEYWRVELVQVVKERRPSVGIHNLAWRGASHLSILWLRLPLASNGTDVDMILGYDAVVGLGQVSSGIRAA